MLYFHSFDIFCCTELTKVYIYKHLLWRKCSLPGDFLLRVGVITFFFLTELLNWLREMVSEDDYEIRILPQELQSVDINLQSFWSNWCSVQGECNTSCCDVPCILFSTVSGHACHSPQQGCVGTTSWPCVVNFLKLNQGRLHMSEKNSKCQQKKKICRPTTARWIYARLLRKD